MVERLGAASFEVLWRLAARMPVAIVEAPFVARWAGPRIEALGVPVVEVFCCCGPEDLRVRHATRPRHPGHLDRALTPEEAAEFAAAYAPLRIGPMLEVDTTEAVDIGAVARWVREELGATGVRLRGGLPEHEG